MTAAPARTSFRIPPMLRAAWDLTELGWRVFPIRAGKKLPATEHGCKDATVDQEQIERWFLRTNHNLGLATGPESALWVLDVDVKTHEDGRIEDGHATLRELEAAHGQLPATVEQRTPGGGRHLFFAWPEKGDIRNSARTKLGEGLDTRGVGGYVVVAPSVRSDQGGKVYEWVRRPGETKLAPAPAWLLKLVQGERKPAPPAAPPVTTPAAGAGDRLSPYARKVLDNQCDRLRQAQPGTRNSTLNEVGFILGQFVGGGAIPEALAQQHLYAAIAAWGADKDQKKTHGTLDRALAAGRAEPKSVPTPRPSGRQRGSRSAAGDGRCDLGVDPAVRGRACGGPAARRRRDRRRPPAGVSSRMCRAGVAARRPRWRRRRRVDRGASRRHVAARPPPRGPLHRGAERPWGSGRADGPADRRSPPAGPDGRPGPRRVDPPGRAPAGR
jgi:hypothetical protein